MADLESGPGLPKSWPLWKKLTSVGIVAAVAIALGVGLGVGLRQHNADNSWADDTPDDSNPNSNTTRATTWRPPLNASWQIILRNPVDPSALSTPQVDIWDLDMYENPSSTFKLLHDMNKRVICYFSAGSYEDWRADKDAFLPADLGSDLEGWRGEKWLKLSSTNVRNIMAKRIKQASDKGCDAIDPDNVDGYQNKNGLGLTKNDSIDFMRFLHTESSKYNMSIGLKNAGDIIPDVLDIVEFSVNEQCVQMQECETFAQFVKKGKPVFNIEYPNGAPDVDDARAKEICSHSGVSRGSEGFSQVMKKMELDGWVRYCDGKTYTTKIGGK